MEGRLVRTLEDLAREGPGSLLVTFGLLSQMGRGGIDFGLLSCEKDDGWAEERVSGPRYWSWWSLSSVLCTWFRFLR